MRVYKVVKVLDDGRLVSAVTDTYNESLTHNYAVNGVTRPRIGKLFAFDTVENARKFADGWYQRVYVAEAEGAHPVTTKMPWIAARTIETLKLWWRGKFCVASDQTPPPGTLACDSIKLIEAL